MPLQAPSCRQQMEERSMGRGNSLGAVRLPQYPRGASTWVLPSKTTSRKVGYPKISSVVSGVIAQAKG